MQATAKAKEMIAAAQFYYVASFFLTVSVEALLEVADHAVEHNKARACRVFSLIFFLWGVGGWGERAVFWGDLTPTIYTPSNDNQQHGQVFAMNLSAPFLVQFFQDQMKQVIKEGTHAHTRTRTDARTHSV